MLLLLASTFSLPLVIVSKMIKSHMTSYCILLRITSVTYSVVFMFSFEHISYLLVVFLLFTLNRQVFACKNKTFAQM